MREIVLRPGRERRVRDGHPWVFSNEIDPFPAAADPGEAVAIHSFRGAYLGTAYFNPRSLIAARILSRSREDIDGLDFFRRRLAAAADYRHRLYPGRDGVRLVHGEADGLPGLVVDSYGEVLSLQLLTQGMERRRQLLLQALEELFAPAAVVARNDVPVRALEGLDQKVEVLAGRIPEPLVYREHGLEFGVDVLAGQKTGAFLDQKENHLALAGRVEGRRVLDLFCYAGGWSLHAARLGAAAVTGVDASAGALELARDNARRNGLEERCRFERHDAFELLRDLGRGEPRYDTVILDPPAFVKSKKKLPEAIRGYLTVNRRAMEALGPGGHLVTCSCSHHLDRERFIDLLRQAAALAGRSVRLLEIRGQAFDHPVLLSCPETEYLKCAVLEVVRVGR